jgi:hypothetical protein
MAAVEGSGTPSSAGAAADDGVAAWAAPATRLAQTGISDNNFMCAVCRTDTQPKTYRSLKIGLAGTNDPNSRRMHHGVRFPYRRLAVFALFFEVLGLAAEPGLVELKLPAHFDPFASSAKAQYEEAARNACAQVKPAEFNGYRWRLPPVAAELRLLSGTSEGKQIYIGFLKTKYGYQIAKLNVEYGTDAQSFTELLESPMAGVDSSRTAVRREDAEFDFDARRDMVEGILAALRSCDRAHADGGIRVLFEGALANALLH